jgi:hypothetical protein
MKKELYESIKHCMDYLYDTLVIVDNGKRYFKFKDDKYVYLFTENEFQDFKRVDMEIHQLNLKMKVEMDKLLK